MEELLRQVNAALAREKWAYVLLTVGLVIVLMTLYFGLRDAVGYSSYFAFDKAARDAASAGSTLLGLQGELESTEPWTKPFAFAGMGFLFAGIGLTLWNIVYRIQWRAKTVGVCVPILVERSRQR